jgi:hypothetical protein
MRGCEKSRMCGFWLRAFGFGPPGIWGVCLVPSLPDEQTTSARDGPIKDKGLYWLTTHNGMIAVAVPERVNAMLRSAGCCLAKA